jgi:hypothetical protein
MTIVAASDDEIPDLIPAQGVPGASAQAFADPSLSGRGRGTREAPPLLDLDLVPPADSNIARAPQEISLSEFPGPGVAAAQLNLEGQDETDQDEDAPWPRGLTPFGDELAVSPEEVAKVASFGPRPAGIWGKPAYAYRVFFALRDLRKAQQTAQESLERAEARRDERLSGLAEEKRPEVGESDRFSRLYSDVDQHDAEIAVCRRALEDANLEGAQALRDIDANLETKAAQRLLKERAANAQKAVVDQADESILRARAAVKKVNIQWRNIEARAAKAPGDEMPDELDQQLDILEQEKTTAQGTLKDLEVQKKDLLRLHEAAENQEEDA